MNRSSLPTLHMVAAWMCSGSGHICTRATMGSSTCTVVFESLTMIKQIGRSALDESMAWSCIPIAPGLARAELQTSHLANHADQGWEWILDMTRIFPFIHGSLESFTSHLKKEACSSRDRITESTPAHLRVTRPEGVLFPKRCRELFDNMQN
ncbi:uncharacterized protein K489DRAFT_59010 [Dissoconium aciculare CBS 342.82]|uniref:Uncharacterized protein n=1 Tax=Dissoconium aciculare CBS 342.82 TaxID=1314786 RepID=A0A6J3LVL5_9PEZI|nr:uncharacterized protein K489DRAFT_59010 [Dissoconium aciculare CBS 342.82]KAF1819805.1 hypothetical protein K489DRAFT_59010 [Dissoconium aciculare CBS 342.82]